MAIPVNNQILAVIPTPLDPKRTNCYIAGSNVVIETIAQYLLRVTPDIRDTHVVSMRIPKTGHEGEEGIYPIEDFSSTLANFDIKLYTFTGGLANGNFQEIAIGSSGGDILLSEQYNVNAIGGILLCSQYQN